MNASNFVSIRTLAGWILIGAALVALANLVRDGKGSPSTSPTPYPPGFSAPAALEPYGLPVPASKVLLVAAGEVRVVEVASGRTAATIVTRGEVQAVIRESRGELLVIDADQGGATLRVFDLNGQPLREAALGSPPTGLKVFVSVAGMTRDEGLLFYVTVRQGVGEGCREGGLGLLCDRPALVVVDPDNPTTQARRIELPLGCYFPSPVLLERTVVALTCGGPLEVRARAADGEPIWATNGPPVVSFVDLATGAVSREVAFRTLPFEQDPTISRNPAVPRVTIPFVSGAIGILFSDGTYVFRDVDGGESEHFALPAGKRPVNLTQPFLVDPSTLAIPFASRYYDHESEGVALFSLADGSHRVLTTPGVRAWLPLGNGAVLAEYSDGALHWSTALEGDFLTVGDVRVDPEVVTVVR